MPDAGPAPSRALLEPGLDRLEAHVEQALGTARRAGRPVLASATAEWPGAVDPLAIVAASRRDGEAWFCFDQPDRGRCLAALGCAAELAAAGPDRFASLARRWRALVGEAASDPPSGPSGAGVVALGGLAFAEDGGMSPPWDGFGAGSFVVPELSFASVGGRTWVTLATLVAPDDTGGERLTELRARLERLALTSLPLLDPAPAGRSTTRSVMPPVHYEAAVARAVERIRAGEIEKIVLAREVEVRADWAHDPAAILAVLRAAFPACFTFAVGRGASVFLGASPELLVRREGARTSTVALAGSTRRSADPAVDDHLGERLLRSDKDRHENEIVARRIARTLAPHAVWVAVGEPGLVKVANVQHLGRAIRAQLTRPLDVLELAGLLHPTPAVGGEPWDRAEGMLPALEGFDRGWYAGPLGWIDAAGDGEVCVALRCALLRGGVARLYVGAGIVADSDPASELAETEMKLGALLPILSG